MNGSSVMVRTVPASRADRLSEDGALDLLNLLLGQISVRAAPVTPIEAAPAGPTEVLLNVQFEGFRYTLTRTTMVSPSQAAALSPREREIVRLIARGLPNKAIAATLDISLWTVATHIRRVFIKLGVNSRAEMVAHVLNGGLLNDRT